jgi:glutamate N-acetyltransferase/amino-acid acetyltransferase
MIGGAKVRINGIAKGAGMIAPDMATMLSFVVTDAPIAAPALQAMLAAGVKDSFNAITVDGDTSTSDTLLLFATGKAEGAPRIDDARDPRLRGFRRALDALLGDLARQVARDGEGARKLLTVEIEGAVSKRSARRIAMSIANSPLVKTAVGGEDANWGRIVMAVGKAGEPAERDRLAIWFGDIRVAVDGRHPASSRHLRHMKNPRSRSASISAWPRPRPRGLRPHQNTSPSTATTGRGPLPIRRSCRFGRPQAVGTRRLHFGEFRPASLAGTTVGIFAD